MYSRAGAKSGSRVHSPWTAVDASDPVRSFPLIFVLLLVPEPDPFHEFLLDGASKSGVIERHRQIEATQTAPGELWTDLTTGIHQTIPASPPQLLFPDYLGMDHFLYAGLVVAVTWLTAGHGSVT